MKVISLKDIPKEKVESPVFTGIVERQSPVTDKESQYSVDYVHFPRGVHNKFHTHSTDQVLIAVEGEGKVVTEDQDVTLKPGDVVLSPAGEKHWHGASLNSHFTHISITAAHTELNLAEDA